jgi:hypothetical protein
VKGKLIDVVFEEKTIEAIVIDPNGLGESKPTLGMGFGMTERHIGIPQNTLSTWSKTNDSDESKSPIEQGTETHPNLFLMSPSKKVYPLHRIVDENNREQLVIEASDWMELAADVLETPGKIRRTTQVKIIQFLKWFAVKGFYASCYTQLFGAYTAVDDSLITALQQRVNYLEQLADELSIQNALLEHQYSQALYRMDSAGLLQPVTDDDSPYLSDWEADVNGDEESDRP